MSADEFEERIVTVPLREAKAAPSGERADEAVSVIRAHLARHFNVDESEVRLDPTLNEAVWDRGRGSPPTKQRVRAARFVEDGEPIVEAEPAE